MSFTEYLSLNAGLWAARTAPGRESGRGAAGLVPHSVVVSPGAHAGPGGSMVWSLAAFLTQLYRNLAEDRTVPLVVAAGRRVPDQDGFGVTDTDGARAHRRARLGSGVMFMQHRDGGQRLGEGVVVVGGPRRSRRGRW